MLFSIFVFGSSIKRIRQNIEQHKFKDIPKLTISLGVAEANEPILSTELLKKWILLYIKQKKSEEIELLPLKIKIDLVKITT